MRADLRLVLRAGVLAVVVLGVGGARRAGAGQLTQDEAALLVLDSARRAYNAKDYPTAAARFRQFIQLGRARQAIPDAFYGLGLTLMRGPAPDYDGAAEALRQAAGRSEFPDRAQAAYYLGVALRGAGEKELAQAKPGKGDPHRNAAEQRFEEASRYFGSAAQQLSAWRQARPAGASLDAKGAAVLLIRARSGQCDVLLRAGRMREAGEVADALLGNLGAANERERQAALYVLGCARFAQGEHLSAGRVLSRLAPFDQEFGNHAQYLLARVHHLEGEGPEAARLYDAVVADYAKRHPQAPLPDYIKRASFYRALVACEAGRYAEALAKLSALVQQHPQSPLVPEAQLRRGYCQVELRQYADAVATLTPLCSHPVLADQAMWWLARAQVRSADPKNPQTRAQALRGAIGGLRRASERAAQMAQLDPGAKERRGNILMEMADVMQLAGQYREAAAVYQTVINERNNPDRAEEAMQRQVAALHLAGQTRESEALAHQFEQHYPKSTLLPAVLFRRAENAVRAAMAAADAPDAANRKVEVDRLFAQAIARHQRLVVEYPDFEYANVSRRALGSLYYRLGRYDDAIAVLSAIPEPERTGQLSTVPYLLGDCLLRTLPTDTADAVAAARCHQQAQRAAGLFARFTASQPKAPQAPDALLKLGHCCMRVAAIESDPDARKKTLTQARAAYEAVLQQHGQSAAVPAATLERAACLEQLGDSGSAMRELARFQADPLRQSPVAPLALLRLSRLKRAHRRADEAVALMAQYRAQHEAALLQKPERKDWVPLLQYEHGIALDEAGKAPEAIAVFEALAKAFPDHADGTNAVWRAARCRRVQVAAAVGRAIQVLGQHGERSEQGAKARATVNEGLDGLREVARSLEGTADRAEAKAPGSDPHLHLVYELAWCYRTVADTEAKLAGGGERDQAASLSLSGRATQGQYRRLIAAAPAAPLAVRARLELAEMLADQGEHAEALELLAQALEKQPPQELADMVRLRIADSCLATEDIEGALPHIEAVERDPKGPFAAHARCLAGEALVVQKQWAAAVQKLTPFRTDGHLQTVAGVSDRALLALGRALAEAKQYDASRQALQTLVQRFRSGPCVEEALFRVGWAWQLQGQQDNAVTAYAVVMQRCGSRWAARALLQTGLCRMQQGRHREAVKALTAVPLTYGFPEASAQALCEAGKAYQSLKEHREALATWQRVLREWPDSPWAAVARRHLAERK